MCVFVRYFVFDTMFLVRVRVGVILLKLLLGPLLGYTVAAAVRVRG